MLQDRVRTEVDIAMQENKNQLTMKFLHELTYLERCIKEALRLHSVIFFISRVCGEDVKLRTLNQTLIVIYKFILFLNILFNILDSKVMFRKYCY